MDSNIVFCVDCGTQNQTLSNYCFKCGSKLQKEVVKFVNPINDIDEKENDMTVYNYTVTAFHGNKEINIDKFLSHNSFESMNVLSEEILDSLNSFKPSQIQKTAIPICLNKDDNKKYKNNVVVQSPHQTGKTLALSIIILQRIDATNTRLQALYVVNSREIAIQTKNLLSSLGQFIDDLNILLAIESNEFISKTKWKTQICIGTSNIIIDTVLKPKTESLNSFLDSFKILAFDGLDQFVSKTHTNTSNMGYGGRKKRRNKSHHVYDKPDLYQLSYIKNTIKDNMYKLVKTNPKRKKSAKKKDVFIPKDVEKKCTALSCIPKDVEISYEMEDNWNCKKHTDEWPIIVWDMKKIHIDFQTLYFSTTYPMEIKRIFINQGVKENNVFSIQVGKQNISLKLDNIKLLRINCKNNVDKLQTLLRVMSLRNNEQIIIFVNTIQSATKLLEGLESKDVGIACSVLKGNDDFKIQSKTMEQFRNGKNTVLIVSNVIARGIDVPSVKLVVNFEIPNKIKDNNKIFDGETFMQRIQRTGRFGRKGICIQLLCENDSVSIHHLDVIQKNHFLNIEQVQNTNKSIKKCIANW
eukprot:331549_1